MSATDSYRLLVRYDDVVDVFKYMSNRSELLKSLSEYHDLHGVYLSNNHWLVFTDAVRFVDLIPYCNLYVPNIAISLLAKARLHNIDPDKTYLTNYSGSELLGLSK